MRDPDSFLADIITFSRRAIGYADGIGQERFVRDVGVQDQVIRCLEVIGEAARRTPDEVRSEYPGVPWAQMAGLRNRLAHEYDSVDMLAVWLTVTRDLPAVLAQLGR